jgi:hypothetical protein
LRKSMRDFAARTRSKSEIAKHVQGTDE